jgi:tetratricopeptide (TPR) repeat protein
LLEDYLKSPLLRVRSQDGNTQYFLAKIHYHLFSNYPSQTLDRALEEVDRALSLGMKSESGQGDPEIDAYLLKATIHQHNGQDAAAGMAYYEAARRYYWINDHLTALQHFQHAVELDPQNAMAWWYRADSSRILSYRAEPPYIDRQRTLDSLRYWEEGIKRSVPEKDESWVFLVRAYIAEQLALLPAGVG